MKDVDTTPDPTRERRLTAAVALLFLPVVLDVFGGVFSTPAAVLEHFLVQAVLVPAIQLDRAGGLEHDPLLLQLQAFVLAGAVAAAWRATRSRPLGRRLLRLLLGLPALGVVVALAGVGAGLRPELFCVAAAIAAMSARGSARRWSAPGSTAALVAGAVALANGATVLASGPGDPPTPLFLAELVGRLGIGGSPPTAALVALFGAALGGALVGALGGAPIFRVAWDPLESARRALVFAVAGVASLGYVAVADFLGCEAVVAHPAVERLHDASGAFAVEAVDGPGEPSAFVAFREKGIVARYGLTTRSSTLLDVRDLPLDAFDGQVDEEGVRIGFPEELGVEPGGAVHAFVEIPRAEAVTALLLLNPATGDVDRLLERRGACFVSSWAWDAGRGRAVAGCEWWGDWMILDDERLLERQSVAGAGEMEELIVGPDGDYLAVSLWTSPYLVRIDPDEPAVEDRRFVGAFNWALEPSTDGEVLYLARFHARQVLEIDARTLAPRRSHRVGYGVRSLAVDDRHGRLLAASTYDGRLYAVDPTGARARESLRLGGWVRDIALAEGGRSLVAGGICGVLRVDLDDWLGR